MIAFAGICWNSVSGINWPPISIDTIPLTGEMLNVLPSVGGPGGAVEIEQAHQQRNGNGNNRGNGFQRVDVNAAGNGQSQDNSFGNDNPANADSKDNTQPASADNTQSQNGKESSSKKKGIHKVLPW